MRAGFGLGVVALAIGCAPAAPRNDPDPEEAPNDIAAPRDAGSLETPTLVVGQTWEVELDGFQISMRLDGPGPPRTNRWRYEVVDVDGAGVFTVEVRLIDEDGTVKQDPRWWIALHRSGLMIRMHEEGYYPPFAHFGRPFVPLIASQGAFTPPIPPWWPTFPLVPGQKLSFMDGEITQSVREVDGLLEVELVANPPAGQRGPWRGVTMYWERGRPFWSKIDVAYVPQSGIPLTQYEFRGEVVAWDGAATPP